MTQTRRCWPWSHDWEKWKMISVKAVNLDPYMSTTQEYFDMQERKCKLCWLTQRRSSRG